MSAKSIGSRIKADIEDNGILLRSVPSWVLSLFAVSVVAMNLLANKELFQASWIALDCGYTLSWISFLLMDVVCKRFGPKASMKISVFALILNLAVFAVFHLLSLAPGHWGAYYNLLNSDPEASLVADSALNSMIAGTWYVVVGSAVAMIFSSATNSLVNHSIGRRLKTDDYGSFALRSFVSTFAGQLVDNLVFTTLVSHFFFGWTWVQVAVCSLSAAVFELLCEVVFSPLGYRLVGWWEEQGVGLAYVERLSGQQV